MKQLYLILAITLVPLFSAGQDFLSGQMKYPRVRDAVTQKEPRILSVMSKRGIEKENLNILIVILKHEKRLMLYAKNRKDDKYVLLETYPICAASGTPGPKLKKGDRQVPEGFYHIDRFNPASSYHLSLGINYPNSADRIRSKGLDPGGDIFIHGSCVSIGCAAITDDKIKELYLYAVHARNAGQGQIPVYIFPFAMNSVRSRSFYAKYATDDATRALWDVLTEAYRRFMADGRELKFSVDTAGNYVIKN